MLLIILWMSVLTSSKTVKIVSRNSFMTLEGIKPPNYKLSPIGLTRPPDKAFFRGKIIPMPLPLRVSGYFFV